LNIAYSKNIFLDLVIVPLIKLCALIELVIDFVDINVPNNSELVVILLDILFILYIKGVLIIKEKLIGKLKISGDCLTSEIELIEPLILMFAIFTHLALYCALVNIKLNSFQLS